MGKIADRNDEGIASKGEEMGEASGKTMFVTAAAAMYEELHQWRANHLEASIDEIAEEVGKRRRVLMGQLLSELAEAADERVLAPVCEGCGEAMTYKGRPTRDVLLSEGELHVTRAYFYCPACERGFSPPG
jgi:hypothetical protein